MVEQPLLDVLLPEEDALLDLVVGDLAGLRGIRDLLIQYHLRRSRRDSSPLRLFARPDPEAIGEKVFQTF
jgi:hypothetical protein